MIITSLKWVPRGQLSSFPHLYNYENEENQPGDDEYPDNDLEVTQQSSEHMEESYDEQHQEIIKKYNLEDYEREDDKLAFMRDAYERPSHDTNQFPMSMDEEDLEDFVIRDTDYLILSGIVEDKQISHLDVCLLPETNEEAYVHHDYFLPAFPLSVEWVPSSLALVGTFESNIEVWDLNIVDSPTPYKVLEGHKNSVLCINSNPNVKHLVASASADNTVMLWDIKSDTSTSLSSFEHHKNMVQSVIWHPNDVSILASGGYDKCVCIFDIRDKQCNTSYQMQSDVEDLKWVDTSNLLVLTEAGDIQCYDIVAGKNRWTLSPSIGTCSYFDICTLSNGSSLIATITSDSNAPLKLWHLDQSAELPSSVYSGGKSYGKMLCCSFCPEKPFMLAAGGESRLPFIIDTLQLKGVHKKFSELPEVKNLSKKLQIPKSSSRSSRVKSNNSTVKNKVKQFRTLNSKNQK